MEAKGEEREAKNVVNHFEAGSNCQVFNGNNMGCIFAMPGSTVTQTAAPATPETDKKESVLTHARDVLASSREWQQLTEAGLVDDDGQPTVSRTEAALMADMVAERLSIAQKWKLFEQLWQRNNMRGDYNKALEQKKSLDFQEKLRYILV